MTLYTTDYLEYYLTLVGWIVNNGIWNILVASGVFALPFVVIVVQESIFCGVTISDASVINVFTSKLFNQFTHTLIVHDCS